MIRIPRGYVSPQLASETSSHALYRARARRSKHEVMIKVRKGASESIRHEAAALEALRGPGVVGLVESDAHALVLEFVRGPTLEERLRRSVLAEDEIVALADALGAILDRIHAAGWVLGDLKPQNVLLRRGRVSDPVLIDFETAVRVGQPYAPRVTTAYAAPERLVGAAVADPRSDLFALGAILHAAAEGASPFEAASRDATVLRVLALEPPRVPLTSPALARNIEALLRKEPTQRPGSYAALRARAAPILGRGSPERSSRDDTKVALDGPRAIRLEGERAEEALLALVGDAMQRGTLLAHVEASDQPYGSIGDHALRLLAVPSGSSARIVFGAARRALASLGAKEASRAALVLADVLAGESDAAARGAIDELRADPELLRSRREEAFLALLRAQSRGRRLIAVEGTPDVDTARLLRVYQTGTNGSRLVFVEGALDVEAEAVKTEPGTWSSEAAEPALRVAAAWAEIFDASELAELAAIPNADAEAIVVRGVAAGLLVADPFGRGFRFRARALRARIAAELNAGEAAAIARPIAWLAARRFPRAEARVARAFAAAGEPLRAAYYAWRGAARALDASDHRGAVPLVALGDEMLARVTGSVRSLLGALLDLVRAGIERFTGDHRAASAAARRALAFLPTGSKAWCEALGERATAAGRLGDPGEVLAVAGALRAMPSSDATFAWDRACSRTAVQLFYLGKLRAARSVVALFRARTVDARRAPDRRRRALSPGCLVTESLYGGRIDEHLELLADAVRVFDSLGDWRSSCLYGSATGFAYGLVGEYARAEKVLRATLEKSERTSAAAALRVVAQHNLGEILAHRRGRLADAIAIESEAIAALRVQGDKRLLLGSLAYRARMYVAVGDLDAAERDVTEAVKGTDAFPSIASWLFATLALVLLEQGRSEEALTVAKRAAAAGPTREVSPALLAIVTARAFEATGKPAHARRVLQRALREIRASAAKIRDRRLRKGFLERVPDHAELARRARW